MYLICLQWFYYYNFEKHIYQYPLYIHKYTYRWHKSSKSFFKLDVLWKLNISNSEFTIKDVRFLKYLKSILHISFILPSNDWVNQKKGVFFGELCICIPYLSRRPGRRRAGSSVSGRLVAMIIFTYKYMCSFNKNIMAMLSILQVCEDERECGVRGCINSSHKKMVRDQGRKFECCMQQSLSKERS